MLIYDELKNIAEFKRLTLQNAEKDYLQNILLLSIYSTAGKELVFKGGTCLYKIYKLDRFSEDLDFTLTSKLNTEKLSNKILADLKLVNIKGRLKEIKEYKNEINIKFLLNGPLYKGGNETQCFIPLNISMRERICIEPARKMIFSMYKDIPNFEVFVMDEKEILAEKVRAILTRMKPRDIYDLWFLLEKNVDFDIQLVNKKLELYNLKFSLRDFENRIEKMKGLWQIDLKNLIAREIDFNLIKKEIIRNAKKTS